jgi:hypothetical protein
MNDQASEAVLVAVAAFLIWLLVGGIPTDLPRRFSVRKLFIWTTIIAVMLGAVAVIARIKS